MRIGAVIYSNDVETVWNAFRFCNFVLRKGNHVDIFLIGKGVECENISTEKFNIKEQMEKFIEMGGKIYACGTCLKLRNSEESKICSMSTMEDLYRIVNECEKVLTF